MYALYCYRKLAWNLISPPAVASQMQSYTGFATFHPLASLVSAISDITTKYVLTTHCILDKQLASCTEQITSPDMSLAPPDNQSILPSHPPLPNYKHTGPNKGTLHMYPSPPSKKEL